MRLSKDVTYLEPIKLEKICNFFDKVKRCESKIALCKEDVPTPVADLSSIVPFFLKLKEGDRFSIVAEGERADQELSMIEF
ncbi:MAG TPA: hypothetical protein VFK44_02830 [Bacillales bacterium]|nr:hypothetical protein [Bacillales bacterium]